MNELIFGKDPTQRVVSVEPGFGNKCVLFIQELDGSIVKKEIPMTHWILYKEQLSPKMQTLDGDQPYKYLMEYDNFNKYLDVLKASRDKGVPTYVCRDHKESFMIKSGVTMYKGLKVKDVSVLSFDLEHTYGIGDTLNKNGRLLLISNTYRDSLGNITKRLFAYDDYNSEAEMLVDWCDWVTMRDPSIVTGHNVFGHDFKILRHSSKKHGIPLRLGRNNSEIRVDPRTSQYRKDGSQSYEYNNVHIYGREIVDTFFLALKFDIARNYENYKLKSIISYEGLEKKDRVFYDASKILQNYKDHIEWVKIKEYAKDDSDDALACFDLMIASQFYWTQSVARSLQQNVNSATGSQMNGLMIRSYLQINHSIAEASEQVEYEGALSDSVPGLHRNCFKIDCVSLYPSIIRQFKIYDRIKDPKAHFLQIMEYFTTERITKKKLAKETGDRFYKDYEQALKIGINSGYGFLGAPRLNYNSPKNAEKVTREGREILRHAYYWATGKEYVKTGVTEEESELSDV